MALPGSRLHSICDLRTDHVREEFGKELPGVSFVSDFEAVINNPEIQAVAIVTPAETHFALAQQALNAGKDVFVEKPLALHYEEGMELVRLAREQERILMVGHLLEYHPAIVRLKELIKTGELGRIRYIYSNRLSLGKIRREENILWSFAPHDIAVILRLIGSLPYQVLACGGGYVQANIADVTVTNLLFDNGVRAHIFVSWLHPFKEQRLVVVGSKKMASFDDVSKRLVLYDQRVDLKEGEPVPIKGEGQEVPFAVDEPLRLECAAFLEAIRNRVAPLTDGVSGARVLRVLQAAQRSLITNGEPVEVPAESFNPFPLVDSFQPSVKTA
jgi:predicted dehydrogenase